MSKSNSMLATLYADSKIHWTNAAFLLATGLVGFIGTPLYIYAYGVSWSIVAVFVFFAVATGFSITAGYHRLFAHRTYEAHPVVKMFYLLFGAATCENSALLWAADHRYHHRFVDGKDDPYNIRLGFWFAHVGWVVLKRRDYAMRTKGINDLLRDPMVSWQNRFYLPIALGLGGVVPLIIGYFLGDAIGCFLLAGVARTALVHHSTFLINSAAHYIGKQPYSLENTSRDNPYIAILTLGEGYHNFHHRFQYDYRNGVRWYDLDPTKWLIKSLQVTRLADNLRRASEVDIFQARLDVQRAQTEEKLVAQSDTATAEKLRFAHTAHLTAYTNWRQLRAHYRSLPGREKRHVASGLQQRIAQARSEFKRTRDSWSRTLEDLSACGNSPS